MPRTRTALRVAGEGEVLKAPPKPFGRLRRIEVCGLLGRGDHDFELDPDFPTILTGANGAGKSTLLRAINAVGTGAWQELLDLPLDSLTLHFDAAQPLSVTKTPDGLEIRSGRRKPFLLPGFEIAKGRWFRPSLRDSLIARGVDLNDPSAIPRTVLMQMHPVERQEIRRYQMHFGEFWERMRESFPAWLLEVPDRFPVRFITEQRLIIHQVDPPASDPRRVREAAEERIADAVSQYSTDLGRLMTRELRSYAVASQREDRFFPQRVVQAMTQHHQVADEELQDLLSEVADRRLALEEVGLVEEETGAAFDQSSLANEQVRHVIKTHADATLRKFDVLEDIRTKLELFTSFLNDHFVGKQARTRAEEGLTFVLPSGESLKPSRLSSGEQQMLVLAYQLLFETPDETLLLIDEPEISLHVGWQRSFIDDITAMGLPHRINFLLATHSPTLIGGREELKRSLDPGRN